MTAATAQAIPSLVRDLAWRIRHDKSLPRPPKELSFVGDGDFIAIGTEFLTHFVEIGELSTEDRMLEIGSGMGRLALPLTEYLDRANGSYDGVDPVQVGIGWSAKTVGALHPNFRFHHLDVRHPIYNPRGALDGRHLQLPFADGAFDFIAMVSVVTHLPEVEVIRYAQESARLLSPGGRVFLTAFVIDEMAKAAKTAPAHLSFSKAAGGPEWHADLDHPMAAVGFDDGWLEATFKEAGMTLHRRALGHWRGGSAENFQDVFVFELEDETP